MPNNKKKYLVNPGYSQSTKKGFAHAGAIITADLLTIENPEKYLDKMAEAGKFTVVKNEKQVSKKENTDPITTDSQRELDPEPEPELPEMEEGKPDDKKSDSGAKKK